MAKALTQEQFLALPNGTLVTIISNHRTGHSFRVGTRGVLANISGGNRYLNPPPDFQTGGSFPGLGCVVGYTEVEVVKLPRNQQIRELKAKLEVAEKKLAEEKKLLENLKKYRDDLDEFCHKLAEEIYAVTCEEKDVASKDIYTAMVNLGVDADFPINMKG